MKNPQWDLEILLKIFTDHAEQFARGESFCENSFNLPEALKYIIQEIIDLKKEHEALSDQVNGYDP